MSKLPFFTIITPVYKGEAFLEQTLNSVLNQTFTHFECLVVNDGSPGITEDEYKDGLDPNFQRKVDILSTKKVDQAEIIFNKIVGNDTRFKYIYKENGGQSSARNVAINKSCGQFLVNLDQDDYFLPEHLQNIYKAVQPFKSDWNFTIFRYQNHQEFWIKDGFMVKNSENAVKQVSKNLTFETALVYKQVSLTFGTIHKKALGKIRYSNRTKGMEDVDIVYELFLHFQKIGSSLKIKTIPVDSLMKREHLGSITTKDQKSGKKVENNGQIIAYKNILNSKFLTFQQKIICRLGIIRFSLAKKPNIITNFFKKVLTFVSKIIAIWW